MSARRPSDNEIHRGGYVSDAEALLAERIERAGKLFSGRVDFLLSAPQLKAMVDKERVDVGADTRRAK